MFGFLRKINEPKKMENEIVDALLQASTYPNECSIEEIIRKIATGIINFQRIKDSRAGDGKGVFGRIHARA